MFLSRVASTSNNEAIGIQEVVLHPITIMVFHPSIIDIIITIISMIIYIMIIIIIINTTLIIVITRTINTAKLMVIH